MSDANSEKPAASRLEQIYAGRKRKGRPFVHVGFDYGQTVLAIRKQMTWATIAELCGYKSVNSVKALVNGAEPSHMQGEALWSLYRELFAVKPPMFPEQRAAQTTNARQLTGRKSRRK